MAFNHVNLDGTLNFVPDVNFTKEKMDQITATSAEGNGTINVPKLRITESNTKEHLKFLFTNDKLANNVKYLGQKMVALDTIYKTKQATR